MGWIRYTDNTDADLNSLRAMASDLETYILSPVLYWPLGGRGPFSPRYSTLTLGGLLALIHRLRARRAMLSSAEILEFDQLVTRIASVRAQWQSNFAQKAEREAGARLRQWAVYLEERPGQDYASEVHARAALGLLVAELGGRTGPAARLAQLDSRLRASFVPGEFIWDAALAPHYPRQEFWYLYGKPRPSPEPPYGDGVRY